MPDETDAKMILTALP